MCDEPDVGSSLKVKTKKLGVSFERNNHPTLIIYYEPEQHFLFDSNIRSNSDKCKSHSTRTRRDEYTHKHIVFFVMNLE